AAWLALYALSVLARDGRRRPYYVLALAAGVAGTLLTANAPVGPAGPPPAPMYMAPAPAPAFPPAHTLGGRPPGKAAPPHHRLLATTLRPRASADSPGGRLNAGVSNGRFRAGVSAFMFAGAVTSLVLGPESSEFALTVTPPFAFLFGVILQSAFQFRRPAGSP